MRLVAICCLGLSLVLAAVACGADESAGAGGAEADGGSGGDAGAGGLAGSGGGVGGNAGGGWNDCAPAFIDCVQACGEEPTMFERDCAAGIDCPGGWFPASDCR